MSFQGKNFLIVGASSGIGLSLAQKLDVEGANLYLASRNKPAGLDQHSFIPLDVTQFSSLENLPEVLHGIAYCPGTINLKPFHRITPEEFRQDLEVNTLGAIQVVQSAIKPLKKAGGASIVFYSTVAVKVGMGFHTSVATAKGALEGLTKGLAAELAMSKIRVNAIAPSLTDTPLAEKLLSSDERREASAKRHPIGRIGTADELAELSKFLLSDQSSWITGQIIGIDGGMSTLKP